MVCDMKEIQIRKNDAGQRLDRFVGKAVPLLPESLLQKYIRLKRIKRNGKAAKRDVRLVEGDVAGQSASEPAASVSAEENGASDAVASAVDALLEADPISNQFEITAMNIEYDFGLKADDVTSYKGIKSNDNGDAGLVLAIQPAAGKAQDVMDTLKTYQQDQVAFYGNYAEFAQAQSNVENAIIDGGDDLVVMVIASNDCSSDLTSAVKDVLGK